MDSGGLEARRDDGAPATEMMGTGAWTGPQETDVIDRRSGDRLMSLWDARARTNAWLSMEDLTPCTLAAMMPNLFRLGIDGAGSCRITETGLAIQALDDGLPVTVATPGADLFRADELRRPIKPLAVAVALAGRPLSRSVRRRTLDGGMLLYRVVLVPLGDPKARPLTILGLLAFRWTDAQGRLSASSTGFDHRGTATGD